MSLRDLQLRMEREILTHKEFRLPLLLDLPSLVALLGNLHLALRHPGNTGHSSEVARAIARRVIERLREEGFPACAEVCELGEDPRYDR